MNNKIISRFYVITLNKKPVYVGYTNRPIEQRFNEHKRDKDFGKIQPEIQQIAQLEYEFTWDINKIDRYANEVNNKECELIQQFNTQNSKYQKANGGGQNWNDIKYFVNTNHNNPKFLNMPESDVLKRIDNEHNINKYLIGFQKVNTAVSIYMHNFITHIQNPATIYTSHFISHMQNPATIYISNFISSMHNPATNYINTFITHMQNPATNYINNFIQKMNNPATRYIQSFIKHIEKPPAQYMQSFINAIQNPSTRYMQDFISHMNNPPTQYMISFITNMH